MQNKTVLLPPSLTQIASVMWVSFIYLSRRLNPFPDAEIDNGKDEEKTKGQLPADRAQLVQTWGEVDVQHLTTGSKKQDSRERVQGAKMGDKKKHENE